MSYWETALPDTQRVVQDEWVSPIYADWSDRLTEYVARAQKPVVLVGHSLGTSLTMHWSRTGATEKIAGAFLVAPSDRGPDDIWPDAERNGFAPMDLRPLPFKTLVLASRNDPYVAYERAELFATKWGADIVDTGDQGHMGNTAGLGAWPLGLVLFGAFLQSLI